MVLTRDGDPFLWDAHTVAEELSGPGYPWSHNPATLVAKVQEEDIDGRSLLTFEHLCSRQELMACLEITLARHKLALGEAIINLRARSRGYQDWRRDFFRKQQYGSQEDFAQPGQDVHPPAATNDIAEGQNHTQRATEVSAPSPNVNLAATLNDQPKGTTLQDTEAQQPLIDGSANPPALTQVERPNFPESEQPKHHLSPENVSDAADERPAKRKRVVPVSLTEKPINNFNTFIPTEADVLGFTYGNARMEIEALPWEDASPHAYLGINRLPLESMVRHSDFPSSMLLENGDGTFATRFSNTLPRGIRLVVNKAAKHLLVKNGRKEAAQRAGLAVIRSPTPSESDEILDLSDIESLDELTLKEMEEEKQEKQRSQQAQKERFLTTDQVSSILDEAIAAMTLSWQELKLAKYQRKGFRLWKQAQLRGTRKRQTLQAQQQAMTLAQRIKNLCTGIMDEKWKREEDVRAQARCIEQSLEDKLYNTWLTHLLESRSAPPKPHTIPRPQRPIVEQSNELSDGELLLSSDEDDFIVPDIDVASSQHDVANTFDNQKHSYREPVKEESPAYVVVDLTQSVTPSSKKPNKGGLAAFLDLSSPLKQPRLDKSSASRKDDEIVPNSLVNSIDLGVAPSFAEPGAIEAAVKNGAKHWQDNGDRWRLTICLIWSLGQDRRQQLFDFIARNKVDKAEQDSIQYYLSAPLENIPEPKEESSKVLPLEVTWIFFCFLKSKSYKISKLAPLSSRKKKRISDGCGKEFHHFHAFLKREAPNFPKDSQIYRLDILDEDIDEDVDEDESLVGSQNTPSKSRKGPAKEIIQNKEAVDLRDRERKRAQEQEARREKLRVALAKSGTMDRDKSRLIVNLSKEEGQALIYINQEIGRRIKEHQIEGVRFMWNQLVLDPEIRQGCLLAHTMGLGKTMQVITLLVTIAESAASDDSSVRDLIPDDLRRSQTLVLCPTGLVDNWMDELLMWSPEGVLGPLRKITAVNTSNERIETVKSWSKDGGILVVGYTMFGKLFDSVDEKLLLETPRVVVADEAHTMKNPNSKIHQACAHFRTRSRIALTGSPLANNVEEYRSMIEWVAPNFLGPLAEFREIYARPIQQGLYSDSTGPDKRKALKRLEALKETVAPKVNRATVKSCMKDDLPPKLEFVLSVPPTALQAKLYTLYLGGIDSELGNPDTYKLPFAQLFSIMNHLALVCNHPRCFRQKVQDVRQGSRASDNQDATQEVAFPQTIIEQALRDTHIPDLSNPTFSRKVELLMIILDEARRCQDKVLVFSQSLMTLDYLEQLLRQNKRRTCRLDGKTTVAKRQEMVKDFNLGAQEVYLISTTAGGVGLNIQGANRVVIFDFKWNPVNDQQAIGRAYRIGQTKKVFVYRFVVAGTFEEDLQNRHVFKTQLASRVVDKKNPLSWSKRQGKLLHPIREAPQTDLEPFLGKDGVLDAMIRHQGGKAIRSIVTTDTFEEEDPNVNLTADEQVEVQNMISLNRLRVSDPEEYERAKARAEAEDYVRLSRLSQAIHQGQLHKQAATTTAGFPILKSQRLDQDPGYLPSHSAGLGGPPSEHTGGDKQLENMQQKDVSCVTHTRNNLSTDLDERYHL